MKGYVSSCLDRIKICHSWQNQQKILCNLLHLCGFFIHRILQRINAHYLQPVVLKLRSGKHKEVEEKIKRKAMREEKLQ